MPGGRRSTSDSERGLGSLVVEYPNLVRRHIEPGSQGLVGFWIGFAMVLGAGGVAGTSLAIVLLSGGIRQPDKKLGPAIT